MHFPLIQILLFDNLIVTRVYLCLAYFLVLSIFPCHTSASSIVILAVVSVSDFLRGFQS